MVLVVPQLNLAEDLTRGSFPLIYIINSFAQTFKHYLKKIYLFSMFIENFANVTVNPVGRLIKTCVYRVISSLSRYSIFANVLLFI